MIRQWRSRKEFDEIMRKIEIRKKKDGIEKMLSFYPEIDLEGMK